MLSNPNDVVEMLREALHVIGLDKCDVDISSHSEDGEYCIGIDKDTITIENLVPIPESSETRERFCVTYWDSDGGSYDNPPELSDTEIGIYDRANDAVLEAVVALARMYVVGFLACLEDSKAMEREAEEEAYLHGGNPPGQVRRARGRLAMSVSS